MSDNDRELTDDDREELLRLVLSEAGGASVAAELKAYPRAARSKFREVVCQAGLVSSELRKGDGGELEFTKPTLTQRGRKRLTEINARRGS